MNSIEKEIEFRSDRGEKKIDEGRVRESEGDIEK